MLQFHPDTPPRQCKITCFSSQTCDITQPRPTIPLYKHMDVTCERTHAPPGLKIKTVTQCKDKTNKQQQKKQSKLPDQNIFQINVQHCIARRLLYSHTNIQSLPILQVYNYLYISI